MAEGRPADAIAPLREGWRRWCEVAAPFDGAQLGRYSAGISTDRQSRGCSPGAGRGSGRLSRSSARRWRSGGSSGCWRASPLGYGRCRRLCSPTSWTRRGWWNYSVTMAGPTCWAGTTAPYGPASQPIRDVRSSTRETGSSSRFPIHDRRWTARSSSSARWTSIVTSTASHHPSGRRPRCAGDQAWGRLLWPGRPRGGASGRCSCSRADPHQRRDGGGRRRRLPSLGAAGN